jgi:hypothetical protein
MTFTTYKNININIKGVTLKYIAILIDNFLLCK